MKNKNVNSPRVPFLREGTNRGGPNPPPRTPKPNITPKPRPRNNK